MDEHNCFQYRHVIDTRPRSGYHYRVVECTQCGRRYSTIEIPVPDGDRPTELFEFIEAVRNHRGKLIDHAKTIERILRGKDVPAPTEKDG